MAGQKFDDNKVPLALIPPEAEEEEARVWAAGAAKYGAHNFRGGLSYLRILSALRRHTSAIIRGEDRDPETGCLHAAHIRCCAAMLIVFKDRVDLDDRWKPTPAVADSPSDQKDPEPEPRAQVLAWLSALHKSPQKPQS